ncbi:asparagine synthase [Actinomadura roseirufa]|uniref:asparagine synthase n=1 Tax=Actinomadura roseirufa TaxID=2094049 RepID=UPI0013F16464|nr:asparagine synthase [Actinomadura roseirufa]
MEFFVLPDTTAAGPVAARIQSGSAYPHELRHASGRPWIIGDWPPHEFVHGRAGSHQVVLLGTTRASRDALCDASSRARTVRDMDGLARASPGSFHLLASVGGRVRAQGSLSAARQIFHTRTGDVGVASNRSDALARLTGAGVDVDALAVRLLTPSPPHPLRERCCWEGVEPLLLGTYLELDGDGAVHPVRWWSPPPPLTPLAEGAGRVLEALAAAVESRVRRGRTLSADLSGGLDSTSLCFLAEPRAPSMLTFHCEAPDAGNDDRLWADRAAAALPGARHFVLPPTEVPPMFANMADLDDDVEAPYARAHVREQIRHLARRIAGQGSTTHITGDGGDELFFAGPAFLHSLLRRDPLAAYRRMRFDRSLFRWRLLPTLREMAGRRSYGAWAHDCARTLDAPLPKPFDSPEIGWDASIRMPRWARPEAVETARRLVRATADAAPMSELRCDHAVLTGLRKGGDATRQTDRITGACGLGWEAPYLDDQVIDAVLALRVQDRGAVDGYKPVLRTVMRGVVPGEILGRTTKAEFSQSAYRGLRRARPELLELCDGMLLADRGLVDADAVRDAVLGVHTNAQGINFLQRTLSCEIWLRSLPERAPAPLGGTS